MNRSIATVRKYKTHVKQILIPCFILSTLTGILTGGLIFLFRICAEKVIEWSETLYALTRANPQFLPLLIVGAILLGLATYFILRLFPSCRGGDSQTTIAMLRGFIPLKWLPNTVVLFFATIIAYFSGMPLGVEGTSTQLGAAVGKATVDIFATKNKKAWDRYIMTGGACGGFAAATCAPLTAILFAFDEAHRRFSPIIFMASTTATVSSVATLIGLSALFGKDARLFNFAVPPTMPMKYLWIVAIVGALCGLLAMVFAKVFVHIDKLINEKLARIPLWIRIITIFVIVAIFGFISSDMIGSGHHVIHHLADGHAPVWYILLLFLAVRSVLFLLTGALDIVGGLSVPAMTIGAMVGALISKAFVAMGVLPAELSPVLVIVGVASFLAAVNRAPLNAITFAAEVLMGFSNLLPITLGVTLAFIVIEPIGVTAFSDVLIEKKAHLANHGKKSHTVDVHLTAKNYAFITGKEVRDILWPANCVVLSVDKRDPHSIVIADGDILHMRYKTYDPEETYSILEAIIGKQEAATDIHDVHENDENYTLPEQ